MSIPYYNQSAPFWDFVASMEDQGFRTNPSAEDAGGRPEGPWGFPFMFGPPGGRQGHWPGPSARGGEHDQGEDAQAGPSDSAEPPQYPGAETDEQRAGSHHRPGPHHAHGPHRGRCGGRSRGGFRGRGGHGWAGPFGRHGFDTTGPFAGLAEAFLSHLSGANAETRRDKEETFKPEADVFDTAESYVVHVSLPGAKKEDVVVNWDSEVSELSIAGFVHRPGDEELLKTLALDERKVGMFERKIRLGSRANPAHVDVDGISARMEDGVLRINVPKLDSGYVEIKKVDVE